jgi:hypothetical protein
MDGWTAGTFYVTEKPFFFFVHFHKKALKLCTFYRSFSYTIHLMNHNTKQFHHSYKVTTKREKNKKNEEEIKKVCRLMLRLFGVREE